MEQNPLYFNPGCALCLYKPEKQSQILAYLKENFKEVGLHNICCRHEPGLPHNSTIINVCAGCDRRFRSLYEHIETISLWEIIDKHDSFVFPNYKGMKMSVHDACPVREKPVVHKAVRSLLVKMNIEIVETELCETNSLCCGDDFYDKIPIEKVHNKMKKRAASMPCENVAVYCVSCIKALYIGGKKPRYLVDLLFNEDTEPQEYDTIKWHNQLNDYIDKH